MTTPLAKRCCDCILCHIAQYRQSVIGDGHRAGFKCVEALGRITIRGPYKKAEWWGAGVVVCLEQGADNSMIYI